MKWLSKFMLLNLVAVFACCFHVSERLQFFSSESHHTSKENYCNVNFIDSGVTLPSFIVIEWVEDIKMWFLLTLVWWCQMAAIFLCTLGGRGDPGLKSLHYNGLNSVHSTTRKYQPLCRIFATVIGEDNTAVWPQNNLRKGAGLLRLGANNAAVDASTTE